MLWRYRVLQQSGARGVAKLHFPALPDYYHNNDNHHDDDHHYVHDYHYHHFVPSVAMVDLVLLEQDLRWYWLSRSHPQLLW